MEQIGRDARRCAQRKSRPLWIGMCRPERKDVLQGFKTLRVEEKINQADVGNAVVVVCPGLEGVVRYHHLGCAAISWSSNALRLMVTPYSPFSCLWIRPKR